VGLVYLSSIPVGLSVCTVQVLDFTGAFTYRLVHEYIFYVRVETMIALHLFAIHCKRED